MTRVKQQQQQQKTPKGTEELMNKSEISYPNSPIP